MTDIDFILLKNLGNITLTVGTNVQQISEIFFCILCLNLKVKWKERSQKRFWIIWSAGTVKTRKLLIQNTELF